MTAKALSICMQVSQSVPLNVCMSVCLSVNIYPSKYLRSREVQCGKRETGEETRRDDEHNENFGDFRS